MAIGDAVGGGLVGRHCGVEQQPVWLILVMRGEPITTLDCCTVVRDADEYKKEWE